MEAIEFNMSLEEMEEDTEELFPGWSMDEPVLFAEKLRDWWKIVYVPLLNLSVVLSIHHGYSHWTGFEYFRFDDHRLLRPTFERRELPSQPNEICGLSHWDV